MASSVMLFACNTVALTLTAACGALDVTAPVGEVVSEAVTLILPDVALIVRLVKVTEVTPVTDRPPVPDRVIVPAVLPPKMTLWLGASFVDEFAPVTTMEV